MLRHAEAVGEMFREAPGFAYEAVTSTAASAAAGAREALESPAEAASAAVGAAWSAAGGAARMLKSSFGMSD